MFKNHFNYVKFLMVNLDHVLISEQLNAYFWITIGGIKHCCLSNRNNIQIFAKDNLIISVVELNGYFKLNFGTFD